MALANKSGCNKTILGVQNQLIQKDLSTWKLVQDDPIRKGKEMKNMQHDTEMIRE